MKSCSKSGNPVEISVDLCEISVNLCKYYEIKLLAPNHRQIIANIIAKSTFIRELRDGDGSEESKFSLLSGC